MEAVTPILQLVSGLGMGAPVIALILWLWWVERTERRELSAQVLKLAVDQIESEKEMTAAINVLTAKVAK